MRRPLFVSTGIVLVVFIGARLASAMLVNGGMLTLRDELVECEVCVLGKYPVYNELERTPRTTRMLQVLQHAVDLDSTSLPARLALGRAALTTGNAKVAAEALQPIDKEALRSPLLYRDILAALSRDQQFDKVIALYEAAPPVQSTREISDTVALAYLDAVSDGREDLLAQVKTLRPGDLYANYYLWKQAQENGNLEAETTYSETLTYFPLEAINPTDERLLDYTAQVIPAMLEEDVWGREKTLNVVSYLVWQHSQAEGVVQLLENLIGQYSAEPDWLFYLAELHHLRGDLSRAEMTYQQVLAVDPEYAQAYLRLGIVSEEAGKRLGKAARWYVQYNELAPDDLLGLKRLTDACAALEAADVEDENCRRAVILQEELEAKTDDRRIVAELLGMPVEDVALGPNLVENGGFEIWADENRPQSWECADQSTTPPFSPANFVMGPVELEVWKGMSAARINGLWIQQDKGESAARAGFQSSLTSEVITAGQPYLFSLYYRTFDSRNGAARVWLSNRSEIFWEGDKGLPATNGAWYHFAAVGWSEVDLGIHIRVFVRSFAPGIVDFDEIGIRHIEIPEMYIDSKSTGTWISGE